ncbi:NAD(P)H-dependent oxidoreductase [Chitinophaga sp.]|uniref:NADPH-dependent FMN reductase n=1 Tax=Chitinophaga sp. TaxID=1869181 RepID=UPI0031D4BB8F
MSKIIGIIAGSLRKESFSKKIANGLLQMAPEGFEFRIIPIDELPIYNQDFDDHQNVPATYVTFRNNIQAVDGLIFVTPEYNRSIPSVLKNALDVGSRPYGESVWDRKPGAVFSNSPGNIGGFGANHHLRQCLTFLNIPVMQQPEVYLQKSNELFDEKGDLKEGDTKEFIAKAVNAYIEWFGKNA